MIDRSASRRGAAPLGSGGDVLVERVAAALYEYATWHPPERGEDWADARDEIQERWRVEARSLLEGEAMSEHVMVRRKPLERLLARHFSGGFQTNELGLAYVPDDEGRMVLASADAPSPTGTESEAPKPKGTGPS